MQPPQVPRRNPRQVFISHAHEDAGFAHRLAGDLQQRGWPVWIAPESIRPGEKWVAAIERGLEESGVFLAVVTPAALASRWVQMETHAAIDFAVQEVLRLLPLRLQPCTVPALLGAYQWVDFTGRYEAGRDVVFKTITRRVEPEPSATIVLDRMVIESPFRLELVRVPAGEFLMGSDPAKDRDASENEQPQHSVFVSEFHIGRYPITNTQYAVYAKVNRIPFDMPAGKDDHPVVDVSWNDTAAFCAWLSKATGQPFRLPTEAEWEKAARGADGRIYPWGDEWDASRCNTREKGPGNTTPVGKYSPRGDSPRGAADMAGNAWEWCADFYDVSEYQRRAGKGQTVKDPQGPTRGNVRVLRGGSWLFNLSLARASYRFWVSPDGRLVDCGFRVVSALFTTSAL